MCAKNYFRFVFYYLSLQSLPLRSQQLKKGRYDRADVTKITDNTDMTDMADMAYMAEKMDNME